jgi:hypothetical protein
VASIAIGLGVFLVGLAIAARIGFTGTYLGTLPIYMGVFGIVWVFCWIAWATRRLRTLMDQLQPLFLVPPGDYHAGVQHSVRWAFDWPLQIRGSILLWALRHSDRCRLYPLRPTRLVSTGSVAESISLSQEPDSSSL